MLTRQKGDVGLGVYLEGKESSFAFGHSGSTRGYRADVVMFPAAGKGAVVMTNADQGSTLTSELMRSLAAELGWPGRLQKERVAVPMTSKDVEGLVGVYDAPPLPNGTHPTITVSAESGKLYFAFPPFNPKLELRAESRDVWFALAGFGVVFTRGARPRNLGAAGRSGEGHATALSARRDAARARQRSSDASGLTLRAVVQGMRIMNRPMPPTHPTDPPRGSSPR